MPFELTITREYFSSHAVDEDCPLSKGRSHSSQEEREKIIAFSILLLAYLSVPSLLFALVFTALVNVSCFVSLFRTGDWMSGLMVALLTVLNLCLATVFKMVVDWLRS